MVNLIFLFGSGFAGLGEADEEVQFLFRSDKLTELPLHLFIVMILKQKQLGGILKVFVRYYLRNSRFKYIDFVVKSVDSPTMNRLNSFAAVVMQ